MATQAGIGVLIGLGIGSGVTAFLMQRIIRRQDNALQQSITRLNRSQEDHTQELNAALAKMEADYEDQLALKIERYQDNHEEQLTELEAEYEARIAALTNIDFHSQISETSAPDASLETETDTSATDADILQTAAIDEPQPTVDTSLAPIPDPWVETGSNPVETSAALVEPVAQATAASKPVRPQTPCEAELAQAAAELGKAAAINRKEAVRAIPQLGKLIKDNDADVRLAAVTALQESGSIKAVPFLRQALRDTDNRIVAAASAALSRFKGAKKPAPKAKSAKKKRRR